MDENTYFTPPKKHMIALSRKSLEQTQIKEFLK